MKNDNTDTFIAIQATEFSAFLCKRVKITELFLIFNWEKVNSLMRTTALRYYLEISLASLIKTTSSLGAQNCRLLS